MMRASKTSLTKGRDQPRSKGSSKEDEATTGCDPRASITDGSLKSRPHTETTDKQGLASECTGGGEKDDTLDWKKITDSEVVSCINRVFDSLNRLAPTTTKYGSPIQALVQAGLEWIESLHTNSVAEEQPPPENNPSPDQEPGKDAPNKVTWECVPIG